MNRLFIVAGAYALSLHIGLIGQQALVTGQIVNIITNPKDYVDAAPLPTCFANNSQQLSDLLYNETVMITKQDDSWSEISALEQPIYNVNEGLWFFVPGWVQTKHIVPTDTSVSYNVVTTSPWTPIYNDMSEEIIIWVSLGTKFAAKKTDDTFYSVVLPCKTQGRIRSCDLCDISTPLTLPLETLRDNLVVSAHHFVSKLYCWGGRSMQVSNDQAVRTTDIRLSSADCSGFINLVYRAQGLRIPRNSRSQFFASHELDKGSDLRTGDLVFFATENSPTKINHVMLYFKNKAGQDMLIESTNNKKDVVGVRIINVIQRLGKPLNQLKKGDNFEDKFIFFGTYLPTLQAAQELRNAELKNTTTYFEQQSKKLSITNLPV